MKKLIDIVLEFLANIIDEKNKDVKMIRRIDDGVTYNRDLQRRRKSNRGIF